MEPLSPLALAEFVRPGGAVSLTTRVLWSETALLGGTTAAAAGLLGSSFIDRFLSDDDGGDDAGGDPFDDDFGGDVGLGDDAGDDGVGGDGMGDDFGMDGWDDDPFDDEGGDEGSAELQERVDDLETELASLSSTVNTVRSENKEISESVEQIGEDVRGLLDIYEMVTRGINPFVDEGESMGGGGGGFEDGSFGLFDDGDGDEADEDDLDEDIAGADAEGFFDDDLLDGEGGDLETDDTETDMHDDGDDAASDGGKSFDELKQEYDSGDADWVGDFDGFDGVDGGDTSNDAAFDDAGGDDFDGLDGGDDFGAEDGFDDFGNALGDESEEIPVETGTTVEPDPEPDPEPQSTEPRPRTSPAEASRQPSDARREGGFEFVGDEAAEAPSGPQKPYLTALPQGYVGDLLVIEWLEFLVEESDPTDAARAVGYYERIEWISTGVAERLRDFLTGFGDIDANKVDLAGTETLSLDHHVQSLKYIRQLDGGSAESLVMGRWDDFAGRLGVRDDPRGETPDARLGGGFRGR